MKVLIRRLAIPFVTLGALILLYGNVTAQAPSPAELMSDANERFSRGEYAEAAQQYESLIADGFRDAALYYNLGNTYFEQEEVGRAILNYLRAERLSPRDPDIRANLELARSHTVDDLRVEGDSLAASLSNNTHRWMTPAELGNAALLLWILGGLALAALFVVTGSRSLVVVLRTIIAGAFVLALIILPLWLSVLYADPYRNTGVVIAGSVEAVDGPGSQFGTEFTLHSGAQVRVVDSRRGWVLVELPGSELKGWLPFHAFEAVSEDGARSSEAGNRRADEGKLP